MGNLKITLILLLFTMERTSAACNQGLGMDANDIKIPDSSITASSQDNFFDAKYGRLNEKYSPEKRNFGGWCGHDCSPKEVHYLQVDLGKAKTITAIATQAVYHSNKWVKSYALSYSYDGSKWIDWKVAGQGKIFPANADRYDTVKRKVEPPITARYMRILPLTYTGNCPCMRAEIYGCEPQDDCSTAVGVDANKRQIPNTAMTSSSEYFKHFAYEGRLHNIHRVSGDLRSWGAWCPMKSDKSPYLQIDLGRVRVVSGIASQGYSYNLWTTQYRLNYSMDGIIWKEYIEQGTVKLFIGNSDNNTIRTHMLVSKTTARFIRFIPERWNNYPKDMPCLRIEIYECLPIRGSVPTIVKGISNRILKRGESFNLTCRITGQPLIEVTWLKNGKSLSTTDMMSIEASVRGEFYETSLDFKNVNMGEDGNRYSCAANYPSVSIQAISTAQITVYGTIPVLKIINVGEDFVAINLGLKGSVMPDITAYEVLLVDFTSSKKLIKRYPYNATLGLQKVFGLKPLTKYDINARLIYFNNNKGSRIPNQQFRTMECKPKNSPVGLSIKNIDRKWLEIQWQQPVNDKCKGAVIGYDVRVVRYDILDGAFHTMTNFTKATSFILSPLKAGNKYNLTVRAKTSAGEGPFTTSSITYKSVAVTTTQTTTLKTTVMSTTQSPKLIISRELVKVKQIGVNKENALNVTVKVERLTNNSMFLDKNDISVTADILEEIVELNGTDRKIGESLVKTVSNILAANSTVLEESYKENKTGVRYVKILESWLEKVNVEDKDISELTPNVIVKKIKIIKNKIIGNIVFEEKDGTAVIVPAEVIEPLADQNKSKKSNESIYFVYYKKNSFFGGRRSKVTTFCVDGYTVEEKVVYTPVLASSIVGREVRNLTRPITLRFKEQISRKNIEKTACVYWDFHANDGMGDWSSEGCKLHKIENKTIICQCDHMTNFAAIMDVYAHTSKACGSHGMALSYISVVGCFLSLIGLFLTMLTYTIFRRLRREIAARIMLQLCFALFVVVVVFLTGLERTKEPEVCLVVGILLHYFTLVAFMWMFMEAIFMYHAFVIVWPPREDNDVLKCTLAAWGLPGIIVAAVAASGLHHYRGKHYCRVNGTPFYAGFLAPICLILVTNFIIFAIIMYKLSTRPTRNIEQSDRSEAMQRLKRAFGIMILMGLTWMFGAFAVSDARLVFQYLFAVCNSLQGFAIFIFYCLSQKNVRDAWYAFITCDTRSELKIRTDSYYERRRLSSASQKTSTLLPRTRTNSSTVMMRHDSEASRMQEVQAMLNDQIKMQTIQELDVEDRYMDHITSGNAEDEPSPGRSADDNLAVHVDPTVSISSAEDEACKLGSQAPLQPYHSYRALSDIKELNDLLNLADKRKSSSKSNEMLVRKSLFVAGSSPLLQTKERMRPVRSCENVNKARTKSSEMIDFGTLRIKNSTDYRNPKLDREIGSDRHPLIDVACSSSGNTGSIEMTKSAEAMQFLDQSFADDNTLDSTYKNKQQSCFNTLASDDKTVVPDVELNACNGTLIYKDQPAPNKMMANGTARSNASDLIVPNIFPLHHNNALQNYPNGVNSSHENIVRWLHDTTDRDDVPSDSSDEYRSSMCSSLNDVNNGLHSCRSSVSSAASSRRSANRRQKVTDSPLGRMVVGPLRGLDGRLDESIGMVGNGTVNHVYNINSLPGSEVLTVESSALYGSTNSIESEKELHSEGGYSASEEEGNLRDKQVMTRNRRKTKSRSGSLGKPNGFIRSAYV